LLGEFGGLGLGPAEQPLEGVHESHVCVLLMTADGIGQPDGVYRSWATMFPDGATSSAESPPLFQTATSEHQPTPPGGGRQPVDTGRAPPAGSTVPAANCSRFTLDSSRRTYPLRSTVPWAWLRMVTTSASSARLSSPGGSGVVTSTDRSTSSDRPQAEGLHS